MKNYVLLKRFTSKEERRRLTGSCLFSRDMNDHQYVALENHINYVYHREKQLSDSEALGLCALFNSALLDRYFRTISGNTQVNATEIRSMSFPGLDLLDAIGQEAMQHMEHPENIEDIIAEVFHLPQTLRSHLKEFKL